MTETNINTSSDLDVLDTDSGSAVSQEIQDLAAGKAAFMSTIPGDDFETKVKTVEAMTNSVAVKQNLGKTINLAHVIVQSIPMLDKRTGEVRDQPRIVLLDADGTAYHAISGGLFTSVKNILGVMGNPVTWPAPLPIHIIGVQGKSGGDYFTAKIGPAPKK